MTPIMAERKKMNYQYSGNLVTEAEISLKGEWSLTLSSYKNKSGQKSYKILLPASVTEKGFGDKNEKSEIYFLSEKCKYVGCVVFEKEINLSDIGNKSIIFYMERTRLTKVWVNGNYVGRQDLLTTEQNYDITEFVHEGKNQISVEVDNTYEMAPKDAILGSHMATEHTQTNWTGILGEIGIRINPGIYPSLIRIYPYAALYKAGVRIDIYSHRYGNERVRITVKQGNTFQNEETAEEFTAESGKNKFEMELDLDKRTPLWSEFDPAMTSLMVKIETSEGIIEKEIKYGLRDYQVSKDQKHVAVNGKNIFIRSETNCAVFPKTGYAPMDEESWDALFDTYRSYGINYVRCHSWCPPDAAFRSADKKGLYIQPELCEWTFHTFEDLNEYDYYAREAKAIIDLYGNHPSLVALTWGNELRSDNRDRLGEFCHIMHDYDNTRLYAEGSNAWYGQEGISEESDFVLAQANRGDMWRGAFAGNRGFINEEAPAENRNYSKEVKNVDKPVISFEVGQFQVYPDYDEIRKYDGPVEARNLVEYQMKMNQNGLTGRDKEFYNATGRLSMRCYREEIEAAMRTSDFAGISLLGIQDFPGQGTALVGMIDSFGNPKEFSKPEEFKAFFSPVTPLLQFDKYSYFENESTSFDVLIHNFGKDCLHEKVTFSIWNKTEQTTIYKQEWIPKEIAQGELNYIGTVLFRMPAVSDAAELALSVSVGMHVNQYEVYVYPDEKITENEENSIITQFDQKAIERLDNGESLLYVPRLTPDSLPSSIRASYISDFWCWVMFKKWDNSGTMGLSLDPKKPVYRSFPTDIGTDPRWWHLLAGSRAMVLTQTGIEPLITMADNIQRNEKLAMAFEVKARNGKVLVTSFNISDKKEPTVKQFIKTLISYMQSDDFEPAVSMDIESLMKLVPGERNCVFDSETTAVSGINCDRSMNALDASERIWDTVGLEEKEDAYFQIDFHTAKRLDTIQMEFVQNSAYETDGIAFDLPGKISVFYKSNEEWKPVNMVFQNEINCSDDNLIHFEAVITESIKIFFENEDRNDVQVIATSQFGYQPFAIRKINVY